MSDEELTEHDRAIVRATVREFMDQIYSNVGRSILQKVFWIGVVLLIGFALGGHYKLP